MNLNKKIKNAVMSTAFSILCAASLSAYQINVTVNDKELEFPLEGVKVSLKGAEVINAETDENGNVLLEIPDSITSGKLLLTYRIFRQKLFLFSDNTYRNLF